MKTRFRFEKLEVWQSASEKDLEPVFEELEILAKRIASLKRSLKINTSKTPFTRQAPSQALDSRPSTLD